MWISRKRWLRLINRVIDLETKGRSIENRHNSEDEAKAEKCKSCGQKVLLVPDPYTYNWDMISYSSRPKTATPTKRRSPVSKKRR